LLRIKILTQVDRKTGDHVSVYYCSCVSFFDTKIKLEVETERMDVFWQILLNAQNFHVLWEAH
jgi:hypothetical protein